jgi:RNA ligase
VTETVIHPAFAMPFAELQTGLDDAHARGMVSRRVEANGALHLYVYTNRCVYEDGWDRFTLLARGLILDAEKKRIAAAPFPKFFNLGERNGAVPNLPFEAFEKLDGSLIIAFHHDGRWRGATKGAFYSEQALWAQDRLDAADLSALVPGATYLFEAVYPENRIVVHYDEPALVVLGAYGPDGREFTSDEIAALADRLGWRMAWRYNFMTIAEMVAHTADLPANDEGLVVRFEDGTRLKLKGAEYRRIHALISRCTPLAMWEALSAGDDMGAIRRELPEEFWTDYDAIVRLLREQVASIESDVAAVAESVKHLSDKDVGLSLKTLPASARSFIFGYRKAGGIVGKQRESLFRAIRPTGNLLPGYTPSYAMHRVMDEMVA